MSQSSPCTRRPDLAPLPPHQQGLQRGPDRDSYRECQRGPRQGQQLPALSLGTEDRTKDSPIDPTQQAQASDSWFSLGTMECRWGTLACN